MNFQNINELDFQSLGELPAPIKLIVAILVCVLTMTAGYYLLTQDLLQQLEQETKKEQTLKKSVEAKQAKVVNLAAYKQQLEDMRDSFGTMLRKLPDKTEVADLLVDVSQTGLAAGLEFDLFRPGNEVRRDFYAELPIKLKVHGDYHQFGEFVSGLAALPRIVTVHNVSIRGGGKQSKVLTLEATAKTYRYLERAE